MDEVKRLRLEKGWSQNELAYHAKLAPSVISLIETGKRDPNATTLRKLAEALEVRIPDLFEESDSGKAGRRSSLEPSLFNGLEDERQLGYEALTAWYDYLGLALTRWEKLRRQFQDLAARSPNEERDRDDLHRALADSREFFRAVERFRVVVGGYNVPRFDATATDAGTRELVWLIRDRAGNLKRITDLFLEYNERLTTAMEARQSELIRNEVDRFLQSVRDEEARTADVT